MTSLVNVIVKSLKELGGIAHLDQIEKQVNKHRNAEQPSIRARLQENSSDTKSFKGNDDLFYSVDGLGKGVWGLREMLQITPQANDISVEGNGLTTRILQETYRILRETKIIRQLKMLYKNECQLCGTTIQINGKTYSEGHHIKPLGAPHNGLDLIENILILCPNCHVKCDYFSIKLSLKNIKFREGHIINKNNIEYHNIKNAEFQD